MDILEAKNIVIKAGHELLKAGLIVRTWGNISCRIDDKTFVITKSSRKEKFFRFFCKYPSVVSDSMDEFCKLRFCKVPASLPNFYNAKF